MKTFRIFSLLTLFLAIATFCFAQDVKTETLKVSGECGMCKKKIEKAAKEAGATYAVWSTNTKVLTVRYNSLSTNPAKIQQKVADAGYDTPDFKASDEAYNKLDECCQYERTMSMDEMDCCKDGKCDMQACKDAGCCKDGKCDMSLCKEKGMAMHNAKMDCSDKGMKGAKMDCSDKNAKSGKMDCCNKSTTEKTKETEKTKQQQ